MRRSGLIRGFQHGLVTVVAAALAACGGAPVVLNRPLPAPSPSEPPPLVLEAPVDAASAPVDAASAPVAAASQPASAPPTAVVAPVLESPGVAARFATPFARYAVPVFEPDRTVFTSNSELRTLMYDLARRPQGGARAPTIRLLQLGNSQYGTPLEALYFSRESVPLAATGVTAQSGRPTVLLIGQQHGDEPAGAEALLVVAQELADGSLTPLLNRLNVVVMPRANPDGAADGRRTTANGTDMNRDHLLLRTPEAQAVARLVREFSPMVVVDLHEYTVFGLFVEKFNAVQRFDALIQYATVANLPEFITKASEEWYRRPLVQSLKSEGLSSEWYYTTSSDLSDRSISMGGVRPDTGRNVNGLRNAVSLLIETRGIGLGRAHLLRRVHTHVTAVGSVLRSTALRGDDMRKLRQFVDAEVAGQACRGEIVVEAAATPSEYDVVMLDPITGADKPVNVTWNSALELTPLTRRPRPCGYWLGPDQADAALHLRALGVQVQRLDQTGSLRGEIYSETSRRLGPRSDVRGSVADVDGVVHLQVAVRQALIDVRPGSYYVGLDQPLANLAVAALEPDTQSSFVANRIVTNLSALARVWELPSSIGMTPMQ